MREVAGGAKGILSICLLGPLGRTPNSVGASESRILGADPLVLFSEEEDLPALREKSPPSGGDDIFFGFKITSCGFPFWVACQSRLSASLATLVIAAGAETSRFLGTGLEPPAIGPDPYSFLSEPGICLSAPLTVSPSYLELEPAVRIPFSGTEVFDPTDGSGGSGMSLGGGIGGGGETSLALPEELDAETNDPLVNEAFLGVLILCECSEFEVLVVVLISDWLAVRVDSLLEDVPGRCGGLAAARSFCASDIP